MISKRLFFFLHSIYGGGPALVDTEKFFDREVKRFDFDVRSIKNVIEY